MKNQIVHEALVDTIIRALRAGSYINDDASVALLKNIPVNSTEAERNALAASLSYGGINAVSTLSNTGDMHCFIDSDDSNPTTPYTNYFKIGKGQQTIPLTDAAHALFSIGSQSSPNGPVICHIGPSLDIVGAGDDVSANLVLGAGEVGGSPQAYGYLSAGSGAMGILSLGNMSLGTGVGKYMRISAGSTLKLNAGTTYSSTSDDLLFNYDDNYKNYQFKAADTGEEKTLFFNGAFGDGSTPPTRCLGFCLGGDPGVQHLDPRDVFIGRAGDPHYTTKATCMIVSPNISERRCGLYVWNRISNSNLQDYTHLVNFHSNIDVDTIGSDKSRLFSVSAYAGTDKEAFFSVRCDGSAYYTRAINHAQADVAEYFEIEGGKEDFPPGTVVKIGKAGKVVPSDSLGDTAVIGVVSTKPAFILNADEDKPKENMVPVAMCGTVPVRCIVYGVSGIRPGDLLVSSLTKGRACCYVSYDHPAKNPSPGSIIGKALEGLKEGEGTIKMLIFNR